MEVIFFLEKLVSIHFAINDKQFLFMPPLLINIRQKYTTSKQMGLLKGYIHVFFVLLRPSWLSWWFPLCAYVKPICPMFKVDWIIDKPPDWVNCTLAFIFRNKTFLNTKTLETHCRFTFVHLFNIKCILYIVLTSSPYQCYKI